MNYGLPYQGSKNRIAKDLINFLPEAENFVDLFGGGGAMSHAAFLSGKYKNIIYNELDTLVYKAFNMAKNGEFKNENRWISRDEFFKLKDYDPYVSLCFSFGNNGKDYMYNPELEKYKKATHYAVFFNDFTIWQELMPESLDVVKRSVEGITDIQDRRRKLQRDLFLWIKGKYENGDENILKTNPLYNSTKKVKKRLQSIESLERLQRLQSLESLQRLQSLERLERLNDIKCLGIKTYNLDYREVDIPENSLIYCDIPYKNTGKYKGIEFDYEAFYEWAKTKKNIYISEYNMPDDFEEVWSKEKQVSFQSTEGSKIVTERLFKTK